jgi:hypothetical protein
MATPPFLDVIFKGLSAQNGFLDSPGFAWQTKNSLWEQLNLYRIESMMSTRKKGAIFPKIMYFPLGIAALTRVSYYDKKLKNQRRQSNLGLRNRIYFGCILPYRNQ